MEEIEQQIAEKVIEKSKEDPRPTAQEEKQVKPKKPRTQKQKEAFEKARAKRLENIAQKKIEEESYSNESFSQADSENPYVMPDDEPPKPVKRRGRPRGSTKLKREDAPRPPHNYPHPTMHQIPQGVNHNIAQQPSGISYFKPPSYYPPVAPPPAQIHNYYYGANPNQPKQEEPKLRFQVEEPEEEEEEVVEQEVVEEELVDPYAGMSAEEQRYYQEPPVPQFKFRFA